MDDAELQAARQKKMQELQAAQERQATVEQQRAQQEAAMESMLRPLLDDEAWLQWNQAKMANRENAQAAAVAIIQSVPAGSGKRLNKEELKKILSMIYAKTHRETRIRRV
jgi:DNA-binding TFAR19-related protein (PDSD5 family)